jgi:hypothetical protein
MRCLGQPIRCGFASGSMSSGGYLCCFSPVSRSSRLPLYLRQTQSHIGRALALLARKELLIHAKTARAAGADGVSKGGGGAINSPKVNHTLMPPEDMEPSAPAALAGV